MYKYFISFVSKGTFGNTIMKISHKINDEHEIEEIENYMRQEKGIEEMIILNYQRMESD